MKEITINCVGLADEAALHALLAKSLAFEAHYGHNLDALYDVLTEAESMVLDFSGYSDFAQEMPGYSASFKEMCLEAVAENHDLTILFDSESVEEE